jgi:hypothetical protein
MGGHSPRIECLKTSLLVNTGVSCQSIPVAAIQTFTALIVSATAIASLGAQVPFSVKVADQTGAVVPSATVRIESSSSRSALEFKTNSQGESATTLSVGTYIVSVRCPGLMTWKSTIDLRSAQTVTVVLRVGPSGSPTVLRYSGPETERQLLQISIPLESLRTIEIPGISTRKQERSPPRRQHSR